MKAYIVLLENGKIYSVRRNRIDAEKEKERLETMYVNATIQEYDVH